MEQELKLVQVDVFRTDSVFSKVWSHQDAKTVLAYDWFVKDLGLVSFWLLFLLGLVWISANFWLEILDLLFLSSEGFELHKFRFKQMKDRLSWLHLPEFVQNLEKQKQTFYLKEKFKLV